jgi:hypothetical protein
MTDRKDFTIDDKASTYSTSSPSITEKASAMESERPTREPTRSPSPAPTHKDEEHELKKVMSVAEAQAELSKVMTSGEGIEYPTGLKLNLISLALCLSVFLMALDNTIIATAIPKITDQFHSLSDVGWYGSA